MKGRILGQRGIFSGVLSGTGYVFVPNDITNREKFISDCYNTCTISILNYEGQRFDNVSVDKNIFQSLDFPEKVNDLGSLVFYVKVQRQNQPIVVAVLNKKGEVLGYQKGQISLSKSSKTGIVSILGDSKKGDLLINVESDAGGNIIVNAKNKNKNNKVKLNIDGDFELNSKNGKLQVLEQFQVIVKNALEDDKTETIISYKRDTGFNYSDQYGNIISLDVNGLIYSNKKGNFEIDKDGKFSFSNSDYSIKDLFTDLISEIEAIKTSTSIGLQPPVNVAKFTSIRTSKMTKILK